MLNTIREHHLIEKNQHIVIGLSGGPDSVCLFHVLLDLAKEWELTLHPVHINHRFRPGAAEADQSYVERIAQEAGCLCRTFVYDCSKIAAEEKITSEEAGRKVRYQSFAEVAAEIAAKGVRRDNIKIAVAQNADDQVETILFRILRGVGTDGLSGISYRRFDEQENEIIRPLLDVCKEDILTYCREHDLHPCIDQTNLAPIYTRNKIRLNLIPYLEKEYNTNIKDTMIRMGKTAAVDKDYLWQQASDAFDGLAKEADATSVLMDGEKLRGLHRAVRQRVFAKAFHSIGLTEDMTFTHFDGCESIAFHQGPSARLDLPRGYYLTKVYDDVKAARGAPLANSDIKVTILSKGEYEEQKLPKDSHAVFDFDLLREHFGDDAAARITLRTRKAGDFIAIGETRTKKLQDYLVDRKVPKDERNSVQFAAVGREILWILPYQGRGRYSARYKLCEDTKKVICIEINC